MSSMRPFARTAATLALALAAACLMGSGSLAKASPPAAHRFANPLLDDVVQMTQAEIPDATILAYLRVRRTRLESEVTGPDLIALRREGVSDDVVEFVARQSGIDAPSADDADQPDAEGRAPGTPDSPGSVDPDESRPIEPDPGDTGLIMGVYDPLPIGGYPCWPAWLAPYDCGPRAIYFDGAGGRRRDWRDRRSARDRAIEGKNDRTADRDEPSGDRSRDRGDDRGGTRRGDDRDRSGSRGSGSDGRSSGTGTSGGHSSGSSHGRH